MEEEITNTQRIIERLNKVLILIKSRPIITTLKNTIIEMSHNNNKGFTIFIAEGISIEYDKITGNNIATTLSEIKNNDTLYNGNEFLYMHLREIIEHLLKQEMVSYGYGNIFYFKIREDLFLEFDIDIRGKITLILTNKENEQRR